MRRSIESTGLAIYGAITGTRAAALSGAYAVFYQGTPPADADSAVDYAANALCVVNGPAGDEGLRWEATSAAGELSAAADQTLEGTVIKTGTPTFMRLEKPADSHADSQGDIRLQGLVGQGDADVFVTDTNFVTGQVIPLRTLIVNYSRIIVA